MANKDSAKSKGLREEDEDGEREIFVFFGSCANYHSLNDRD